MKGRRKVIRSIPSNDRTWQQLIGLLHKGRAALNLAHFDSLATASCLPTFNPISHSSFVDSLSPSLQTLALFVNTLFSVDYLIWETQYPYIHRTSLSLRTTCLNFQCYTWRALTLPSRPKNAIWENASSSVSLDFYTIRDVDQEEKIACKRLSSSRKFLHMQNYSPRGGTDIVPSEPFPIPTLGHIRVNRSQR